MTVITEPIGDIIGEGVNSVRFKVPQIRESNDGTRTVVPKAHTFLVQNGVLTTDDLDPGAAIVTINGTDYTIVIPYSVTPVRLWDLINANLDPPASTDTGYVKNGGGITIVQGVTASEYASMPHNPATLYFFTDGS